MPIRKAIGIPCYVLLLGPLMLEIDIAGATTQGLIDYDQFMLGAAGCVSALALGVWANVLDEMDDRGLVTINSRTFEDIANADISRHYTDK